MLRFAYLLVILWRVLASVPTDSGKLASSTWVGELVEDLGYYHSIRLASGEPLVRLRSKYQLIEVFQTEHFGKMLVLDGVIQLTEKDADGYNEMMAHIPLFAHKNPRRVLIVGGGDGYVLAEVLKHPSVEYVDHVDLDGDVIKVCWDNFDWGHAWEDQRVHFHAADGVLFVEQAPDGYYDVIIQDSSDPSMTDQDGNEIMLPSSVLYSPAHFEHLSRILADDGILNLQAECMHIPSDLDGLVSWREQALSSGFQSVDYGSIYVASYPSGQIGCLLCQKDPSKLCSPTVQRERFEAMCRQGNQTSYYHPGLQRGAFDLPLWAEEAIYGSSVCRKSLFSEMM